MDYSRCDIRGCQERVAYKCECRAIFVCQGHLQTHLASQTNSKHSIDSLLVEIPEDSVQKLKEAKRKLLIFKNQAISTILSKKQSLITKISNSMNEDISSINTQVSAIIEEIDLSSFSLQANKYMDIDYLFDKIGIIKSIACTYTADLIAEPLDSLCKFESKYSYYFVYKSKDLIQIDHASLTRKLINLESLPENLGFVAGVCQLRNNEVFYTGGYYNLTSLCSTYIINPLTKQTKKLADLPIYNRRIVPLKINNYIYVFGGFEGVLNRQSLRCVYKYSIDKDKWRRLNDMPVASESVYSVTATDSVLLAGYYTNGIFRYDIENDSYTKVFTAPNGYCLLLKNDFGELYYLNDGSIYESSINNYLNWGCVGSYRVSFDIPQYYPQLYQKTFYVTMRENKLIGFNYESLICEDVSSKVKKI